MGRVRWSDAEEKARLFSSAMLGLPVGYVLAITFSLRLNFTP